MKKQPIRASTLCAPFFALVVFTGPAFRLPVYAAPFQNLDFEVTAGVEVGLPHWQIPEGVDYLYNLIFAGEGSVTLFDHDFAFGHSPIEGNQSVLLILDPLPKDVTGGELYQDGDVPNGFVHIEMLVTDFDGFRVSMDGVNIPMSITETMGDVHRVSGNVSSFAGTTARLRIRSAFGSEDRHESVIDAIEFVMTDPMADFDDDGDVDGDDFLIWQSSFNTNASGDADGDGDTDGDDFLIWQSEFGSGSSAGSVSEPSAIGAAVLILIADGAMSLRRLRSRDVLLRPTQAAR